MPDDLNLVDQLDLCILAYQLHSQTLVWPLDPYAEEMLHGRFLVSTDMRARRSFMKAIARTVPHTQHPGRHGMRGPPGLYGDAGTGWRDTTTLDPILYDYSRVSPFRTGFARPDRQNDGLIVYDTPAAITARINDVHVVSYTKAEGPNSSAPKTEIKTLSVNPANPPANVKRTDTLYCFEGGTGVDRHGAAAWSLMGYVLERERQTQGDYDIYVVFRGSRSGAVRGLDSLNARGSPDWKTDMGWGHGHGHLLFQENDRIAGQGIAGKHPAIWIHQGFGRAISTMMPPILQIFKRIQQARKSEPTSIRVMGHSLGGALAQGFASCLLLGHYANNLGQLGNDWPNLKTRLHLVTYSAPPFGDPSFAAALSPRLASAYRIWIKGFSLTWDPAGLSGDPIPRFFGSHVGTPIPLSSKATFFDAHEPLAVRASLNELMTWIIGRTADTLKPWKIFKHPRTENQLEPGVALESIVFGDWDARPPYKEDLLLFLNTLREAFQRGKLDGATSTRNGNLLRQAQQKLNDLTRGATLADIEAICTDLEELAIADRSMKEMFRLWLVLVLADVNDDPTETNKAANIDFVKTGP